MSDRSLIFNAKGAQIGYIEGERAFDLTGRECCRYARATGNLSELNSEKIVGYVSLDGAFAGLSWISDELFGKPSGDLSGPHCRQEPATPLSPEEGGHAAAGEVKREEAEGCVAADCDSAAAEERGRAFEAIC